MTSKTKPKTPKAKKPKAGTALVALPQKEVAALRVDAFCFEYLKHFNATRAFKDAFNVDYKNVYNEAYKYMQRVDVRQRIAELTKQKFDRLEIDTDRLIEEAARIVFFDIEQFITVDAFGKPSLDLNKILADPEAMRCLDMEFGIGVTKDGDKVETYKVKAHDKLAALEKLFKLKNLYAPDMAGNNQGRMIQVNVSFPIPASGWRDTGKPPESVDATFTDESDAG